MPIVSQVQAVVKRIDNSQLLKLQDIVANEVQRRDGLKNENKELKKNG